MSESHRDHDKSSNTNFSHAHRNSKVDTDRSTRKRSHLDSENIDAKVYVTNIPTKKVTDQELLNFFKPFGKISDIRVFKDHLFVQYNRIEDANKLIKEAQIHLEFKGNKLNVLPAREIRSTSTTSSKRSHDHRSSSNYESERKRCPPRERIESELDDRARLPPTRSDSHRSSNEPTPLNSQVPYAILTGPKDSSAVVDCQIIIVNVRQRDYAEEIESRLCPHGLITSIILLREDFTLVEAIENAARLNCLYGIIAMPMHEERRTASFHILYGQTEEHRNLALEDGIHIIVTNFLSYKQRLRNDEPDSYRVKNDPVVYTNSSPAYEHHDQSNSLPDDELTPPVLTLSDKLPLSMLLCLLADGRQLTLEEIDRVLVYLLEKKAKMLTLPPGTLPPLPAQYATVTTFNHQTDTRPASRSDPSPGKSSSSSAETSSSIAEQIRQILSTNIVKPNSTASETTSPPSLSDTLKAERTILPLTTNNSIKDSPKEYAQQSHNVQPSFSYAKSEPMSVAHSSYNYTPSSVSTTVSMGSFAAPSFSSYNSITPSLPLNSGLKPTPSLTVPNFVSQPSQYFYQVPPQPIYQSPLNSNAANAAAALYQAYSQFNVQPNGTPPMVNQQISGQQQQIRK